MIESQNKMIKRHLEEGKPITSIEALRLYGCLRLSGRIYDLRKGGLNIRADRIVTLTGKRIAKYRLIRES